jgi:2,4-diketo-3-deoxy-L-fuconate hydrolase
MKLIRHGNSGQEKPGILDADGSFRDLSSIVTDIDGESLSPDSLSSLGQVDLMSLPVVDSTTRLGPCVGNIGKLVCIGLNYSDHAKES